MSIIVEDGTGLSTAVTYVTVADADTYHSAMGNTGWTGADSAKEIALRRAAQYIDTRYQFRGQRLTSGQALEWPRVAYEPAYRVEEWPVPNLKAACCEAALRALSATLQADVKADQLIEQTIGPITQKWASKSGQMRYPVIDQLLARYAVGGVGGALRIERAS